MKRRFLKRSQDDSLAVMDISSLVDICFLLLIYFIVTSVITPAERDLPMGPPSQEPTTTLMDLDPLFIHINQTGQVFVDDGSQKMPMDSDSTVRELPLLEDCLRMYQQGANASGQECMVVIDAHDEVTTQRVVDVLNTLAGLDIEKVTFRDPADSE